MTPDSSAAGSAALPQAPTVVSRCPGCGAVLAAAPGLEARHAGASPSCTRLFDVTVRGLRDEAPSDLRAAGLVELASTTYDAQHGGGPGTVQQLRALLGEGTRRPVLDTPPAQWRSTVADVAADLDVVDLPVLLRSWAQAVSADWAGDLA